MARTSQRDVGAIAAEEHESRDAGGRDARPGGPLRARRLAPWWLVAVLTACSAGAPTEPLAALRIEAPASVVAGGTVTVTVTAIGSGGSDPLASFSGTVTLTLDDGTVEPATLHLSSGRGDAQITLGGVVAGVTLTASVGAVAADAAIDLLPIPSLPGAATASAATALPFIGFRQRATDFAHDAPDLPGLELSFNTLTLILTPNAGVAAVNDLLARHDAVVVGFVPGIPGSHGAIVVLRLPVDDHASMLIARAAIAAEPLVVVVHRESLPPPPDPIEPTGTGITRLAVPGPNAGEPFGWTWEREDHEQPATDANWGLERIRVPQMWNLNQAAADSGGTLTGVLDSGFPDHADIAFADRLGDFVHPTHMRNSHGIAVTGIIGARYDNDEGVDGVNPLALLVGRRYGAGLHYGLVDFIEARPGLRVINASVGKNWYLLEPPIDPNTSAAAQDQMTAEGATFAHFLEIRRANGAPVPLLTISAGNSSTNVNLAFGDIEARWNSAAANAALVHGVPGIIVVEAVQRASGGALERAYFSNVGGHVSAPGDEVWTTAIDAPGYRSFGGTSAAAPHVAGIAGFLFALAPAASNDQIVAAIMASTEPAASIDTAPVVDAFRAVIELDAILGQGQLVKALTDIDDGTLDGNQRLDLRTGSLFAADTDGIYGPRGDGAVDMRDFRRWRDWLLQIEDHGDLDLDGGANHPKKDPNLDGTPSELPDTENTFPRGDFNGDGLMSRDATAYVGGAIGALMSDLDMLKIHFSDPHYGVDDLDDLIDSGDLEIWTETLFERADVVSVVTTLRAQGAAVALDQRTHTRSDPRHVYTLSTTPGVYSAKATARDASGHVVATAEETFVIGLGSDTYWDPVGEGVEPASNVELLATRAALRAYAWVEGDPEEERDDVEGVVGYANGLTVSASGSCNGSAVTASAAASASFEAFVGADSRLLGFTGTTHVSHDAACGAAFTDTFWEAEFLVSGSAVVMRVDTVYVATPPPPVAFAHVNIQEVGAGTIVNTIPPAPATFSEEFVLPPGHYRLWTGSFTDASRGDEPMHTVDQEFEVTFEKAGDE